jgi:FAD synthase
MIGHSIKLSEKKIAACKFTYAVHVNMMGQSRMLQGVVVTGTRRIFVQKQEHCRVQRFKVREEGLDKMDADIKDFYCL